MYELLMINTLVFMNKAQSQKVMIGVYILAFLWFLAMVWMTYLSDEMDINGANPGSYKKHKQREAKTKQSQAKDAKKKHHKQSKIIEPYDTKAFRKDSANFDIDGFWRSYTRKNKKK